MIRTLNFNQKEVSSMYPYPEWIIKKCSQSAKMRYLLTHIATECDVSIPELSGTLGLNRQTLNAAIRRGCFSQIVANALKTKTRDERAKSELDSFVK